MGFREAGDLHDFFGIASGVPDELFQVLFLHDPLELFDLWNAPLELMFDLHGRLRKNTGDLGMGPLHGGLFFGDVRGTQVQGGLGDLDTDVAG